MERHRSTFSGLIEYGDDNVRYLPGNMTCALFARNRTTGQWDYVGQWHSLTSPPDGKLHFSRAA